MVGGALLLEVVEAAESNALLRLVLRWLDEPYLLLSELNELRLSRDDSDSSRLAR